MGADSGIFTFADLETTATDPSYSLTLIATVTHPAGAFTSNWDASISAVPEPVAFFVWSGLMGVAGMTVFGRRRASRS
jgi:hypothetical protein